MVLSDGSLLDAESAPPGTGTADGTETRGKSTEEKTLLLGARRAEAIKERLIARHGIDDGRLTLCAPEFDEAADAKPRVAILF
jgi:hypothetical protein